tara:strand:+ start:44 stop:982 length:939 start_codon:yes stop_codon:yes gene_type:complete
MNILIIGTKVKLLPIYNYCKEKGYGVICIHTDNHENNSQTLVENSILSEELKDEIFYDFFPDQIINFKEQAEFLQLEYDLNTKLKLETFLTKDLIKFFSSKREQDKVFKSLNIPTVPNESDKVIVKYDRSGGTNFKVINRNEAKAEDNIQDYLDIDYIISCHFYSDGNKWYHLNNHIMMYEDNCPARSMTPYQLAGNDKDIIEESIQKLSKEIKIENKLFGWQFLKDKQGNLYSIDFNLRPFGGFDKGSYDIDVSNENWSSYIFGNVPPKHIAYTNTVECFYKKKQIFGYSDVNRVKTKLTNFINFEVNTYD